MAQEFADFEVDVDLTDTPIMTGEFSLCPAGEYDFDVVEVIQKPSSKNNQMIVITAQVVEGQENAGQRVWANYVLVPQSLGRLKALMVACGAPLDKFRASNIMGARFHGTVVHTLGEAQIGADGVPKEPRTFANLQNEVPIAEAEPVAKAPAATPPIARPGAKAAAPATKPANGAGAPRRA